MKQPRSQQAHVRQSNEFAAIRIDTTPRDAQRPVGLLETLEGYLPLAVLVTFVASIVLSVLWGAPNFFWEAFVVVQFIWTKFLGGPLLVGVGAQGLCRGRSWIVQAAIMIALTLPWPFLWMLFQLLSRGLEVFALDGFALGTAALFIYYPPDSPLPCLVIRDRSGLWEIESAVVGVTALRSGPRPITGLLYRRIRLARFGDEGVSTMLTSTKEHLLPSVCCRCCAQEPFAEPTNDTNSDLQALAEKFYGTHTLVWPIRSTHTNRWASPQLVHTETETHSINVPICGKCLKELNAARFHYDMIVLVFTILGGLIAACAFAFLIQDVEWRLARFFLGLIAGAGLSARVASWIQTPPKEPATIDHGWLKFENKEYEKLYLAAHYGKRHRIRFWNIKALGTIGRTDEIQCRINGELAANDLELKLDPKRRGRFSRENAELENSVYLVFNSSGKMPYNFTIVDQIAPDYVFEFELFRRGTSRRPERSIGRVKGELRTEKNGEVKFELSNISGASDIAQEEDSIAVTLGDDDSGQNKFKLWFRYEDESFSSRDRNKN